MYLFMEFCSPAKFYFFVAFLTLLYIVILNNDTMVWIALKAISFIGWSFLLNWFCSKGYKALTWLAAIVPHMIFLFITMAM